MENALKIAQTFNGQNEWQIAGRYFKLLTTINPVDVELWHGGQKRLTASQVEGGFYQRIAFDKVRIATGANEPVAFLIAPEEGGSDRFTGAFTLLGTADVSDRAGRVLGVVNLDPEAARYFLFGDDETEDGEAFLGSTQPGPVAAQVCIGQLFNPVASGRVLLLDRVILVSSAAERIFLKSHNAALVTLITQGINKFVNGAAGLGAVRGGTVAAGSGTILQRYITTVNVLQSHDLKPPIIIPEGFGVHTEAGTVNTTQDINFQWRERVP